ncbi:hypothetical protein VNI00_012612, partial [Paramarasmius palmivorus]
MEDAKTRSEKEVANAFSRRDRLIIRYNHARQALINLGLVDPKDTNSPYPHMRPADTHRLRVNIRRQAGDSRRSDGMLWRLGAASEFLLGVKHDETLPIGFGEAYRFAKHPSMTQVTQRESAPTGPRPRKNGTEEEKLSQGSVTEEPDVEDNGAMVTTANGKKEDGWIWKKNARTTLNEQEMKEWEEEGDRVQWMCAEAEMYRWMEQLKIKHVEFERTIAHFKKMEEVWVLMAVWGATPGYSAHAFRQGTFFRNLATQALSRYHSVCHPAFAHQDKDMILADKVQEWRNEQLKWMDDMGIHRAYLDAKKV